LGFVPNFLPSARYRREDLRTKLSTSLGVSRFSSEKRSPGSKVQIAGAYLEFDRVAKSLDLRLVFDRRAV